MKFTRYRVGWSLRAEVGAVAVVFAYFRWSTGSWWFDRTSFWWGVGLWRFRLHFGFTRRVSSWPAPPAWGGDP
jgi:hypothetical protein